MSDRAPRAVYLEAGGLPAFAMLHEADGRAPVTGVLLVPPFGWDDVASYRSRRQWAEHLAAAGRPALRLDLPGSGDSAGGPDEPELVDAWVGAIAGGARWLRDTTGCQRVAVVGLGLGGLLALAATERGAPVDDLVLWGAPGRGRAHVRELRAFARLDASGAAPPEPEVGLVVNGHALRPATVDALSALDASAMSLPPGLRALVLDRDGIAPDARLVDALRAAGAAVEVAGGQGWGAMSDRPQDAVAPRATIARVDAWLAQARAGERAGVASPPTVAQPVLARSVLRLEVDGRAVVEEPLTLDGPSGRTFGILTRPDDEPAGLTLVALNAGAIRRIGPNRMYVELARRWAARGVATLRLDVDGIGDADGDGSRYADDANFHLELLKDQVREALDALAARGLPRRTVALGLCSGAHWAFHTALRDDRVAATILLNPRALFWDDDLGAARDLAYYVERARSPETWRRAVRGDLSLAYPLRQAPQMLRRALRVALGVPAKVLARVRARRAGAHADPTAAGAGGDRVAAAFDDLSRRGIRTVLAFAAQEPVFDELGRGGHLARVGEWPGVEIRRIGGDVAAHTLQPLALQREAHAVIDEVLAPLATAPPDPVAVTS